MTASHWAAQHGHREVAELLLRYGTDVHCLSKSDETPFDIAMDTSYRQQVNINPESHYILTTGELVNLSELVGTTRTTVGKSESAEDAESMEPTFQRAVGDGGQRVITIVTDHHGSLQPAALGQQYVITLQGQQMAALTASAVTQEGMSEEAQQPSPSSKWKKAQAAHQPSLNVKKVKESHEQLERQLQEANLKAQEYQQQLLQKEQEAEQNRLQLEQAIAMSYVSTNDGVSAANISLSGGNAVKQDEEEVKQSSEEAATR